MSVKRSRGWNDGTAFLVFPWARVGAGTAALAALVAALALVACMVVPAPAGAAFGLVAFDGDVLDEGGDAFTQAGGHPFSASTVFEIGSRTDEFGTFLPDGALRSAEVDLPAGFVGNPTVATRCASVGLLQTNRCPASSQVGVVEITAALGAPFPIPIPPFPVYSMEPRPGVPAAFGFKAVIVPVVLEAGVRSGGDYGVRVDSRGISQGLALFSVKVTLWGTPADPVHDVDRGFTFFDGIEVACSVTDDPACSNSAGLPPRPFLTNPTACPPAGVGLETRLRVESWDGQPGDEASSVSHLPPGYPLPAAEWGPAQGPTGCELVPFEPEVSVQPTSTAPDSPTGLEVSLRIPQDDVNGLAPAHLKRVEMTFPEGMTVNPASADGLAACTPVQIGLGDDRPAACPESSRVGTVEVVTPLLEERLTGGLFVASQGVNPFGTLIALYLAVEGSGVNVKLPGRVDLDPATGRVSAIFDDNPQLPFSELTVRLKGGPRAPLATPPGCGTKTVEASLSPWSAVDPDNPTAGEIVTVEDTFHVDCPGMAGFAPSFTAGTGSPVGGAFSPFMLRLERPDRQEFLDGLDVELPTGLVAKVKDVPLCAAAAAAAGACPAASRVGTVTVAAGPGSSPYFVTGTASLTEAYRGGQYGLSIAVPAKAGPFDLGLVVVRQALHVDPVTAEITAVSDPIPTIIQGIPLRLRLAQVDVDRPGFIVNPTSCAEKQVRARAHSQQGSTAVLGARFQAADCQALRLRPRMSMRLTGRRQVADGRHPGLRVTVRQRAGQANLRQVKTVLPLSLALDPDNAKGLCEFDDGQRVACPAESIIGQARAVSPLLNQPLTGPVYFVKNVRIDRRTGNAIRTLPTLLVTLRGEIAIDLRASSSVRRGKLVTTFPRLPDAALQRFALRLRGGRNGILAVTNTNLCRRPRSHRAIWEIDGQNGRQLDRRVRMRTPCRTRRSTRPRVGNVRSTTRRKAARR